MAALTKSSSGNVTTYTITDVKGNTVAVAVTNNPGSGLSFTFTSVGNLLPDGAQMLAFYLLQLVTTGLFP